MEASEPPRERGIGRHRREDLERSREPIRGVGSYEGEEAFAPDDRTLAEAADAARRASEEHGAD